jgi:hypothetical protein
MYQAVFYFCFIACGAAGRLRQTPLTLNETSIHGFNASKVSKVSEAVRAAERRRANPICLADTGLKCAAQGDCQQQSMGCSTDGRCLCLAGRCADVTKTCRDEKSKWQETEIRIAPAFAPKHFVKMVQNGGGPPEFKVGYPANNEPEALWLFALQPDKKSLLLTTKQSRFLDDGFVMDLPPAPWPKDQYVAPIQAKLESAGQAEWQLEQAPKNNWRLRHVASDRYLMAKVFKDTVVNIKHAVPQKKKQPVLTTCAPQKCLAGEADFDIWPHTEHPFVAPKYNLPKAPWEDP